jgi:spermidine/putrescine transport system permease protein
MSPVSRVWRWIREHAVMGVGILAVAYMLIPILVIAVFSFNDPKGKFNFTWEGFTLSHWENAFGIPELTDALVLSLQLAALSTLVATSLGTLLALGLVRYQFAGRRLANLLIVIPMATPEVVLGAALLSMFVFIDVSRGFSTLWIAHIMFSISFVVVVVRSRLIGFDRSLEEASRDLGATAFTTFRTITLPLLAPGLVAAALLAFALSLDDFVISNFNSGTTVTFPLFIFGASQRGIPVEVNVLATLLFVLTAIAMGFTVWQQHRAEKLAAIRPDEEIDTGLAALASGQRPVAGEPGPRPGAAS